MGNPAKPEDKYDHSDHPLERSKPEDLATPGGGEHDAPKSDPDSRGGVKQNEPVVPPDS